LRRWLRGELQRGRRSKGRHRRTWLLRQWSWREAFRQSRGFVASAVSRSIPGSVNGGWKDSQMRSSCHRNQVFRWKNSPAKLLARNPPSPAKAPPERGSPACVPTSPSSVSCRHWFAKPHRPLPDPSSLSATQKSEPSNNRPGAASPACATCTLCPWPRQFFRELVQSATFWPKSP